jgi:hypothetical protein
MASGLVGYQDMDDDIRAIGYLPGPFDGASLLPIVEQVHSLLEGVREPGDTTSTLTLGAGIDHDFM